MSKMFDNAVKTGFADVPAWKLIYFLTNELHWTPAEIAEECGLTLTMVYKVRDSRVRTRANEECYRSLLYLCQRLTKDAAVHAED